MHGRVASYGLLLSREREGEVERGREGSHGRNICSARSAAEHGVGCHGGQACVPGVWSNVLWLGHLWHARHLHDACLRHVCSAVSVDLYAALRTVPGLRQEGAHGRPWLRRGICLLGRCGRVEVALGARQPPLEQLAQLDRHLHRGCLRHELDEWTQFRLAKRTRAATGVQEGASASACFLGIRCLGGRAAVHCDRLAFALETEGASWRVALVDCKLGLNSCGVLGCCCFWRALQTIQAARRGAERRRRVQFRPRAS